MSGKDSPAVPGKTPKEIADRVLAHLRAAAAEIPGYVLPHPLQNGFVRGHRTVPVDAIKQVIEAVNRSKKLQGLGKFDANQADFALQFNDAFRQVVDELKTLLKGVIFTMELQKATVASATLQMYTIMRGLARTPSDDDELVWFIEHIGEILRPRGKGRKGKKVRRKRSKPATEAATSPEAEPGAGEASAEEK
jgi:hypothetical protein